MTSLLARRKAFRRYVEEHIPMGGEVDEYVMTVLRGHPRFELKVPPGAVVRRVRSVMNPRDWEFSVTTPEGVDNISWVAALKGAKR
jgi:hypothetical protein